MEKTISEKICELRKAQRLTQEQLGERLGISGQAVSKWENGAALPDILLLPDLCDALGTTLDDLLGATHTIREHVISDFCAYARENGRAKAVQDVISRLPRFNNSDKPIKGVASTYNYGEVIVSDDSGMGFVADGEGFKDQCLLMSHEMIVRFLKVFTDIRIFSVLKAVLEETLTLEEICEKTGFEQAEAQSSVLALTDRNILSYGQDKNGKLGYIPTYNVTAVWLVLAGCKAFGCGGEEHAIGQSIVSA